MKYRLVLIITAMFLIMGFSHRAIAGGIPASFKWGINQTDGKNSISKNDTIIISVTEMTTKTQTEDFLKKTEITLTDGDERANASMTLYEMISRIKGADFANGLAQKVGVENLVINDYLGTVSDLSEIKIKPFLGNDINNKPIASYTNTYTIEKTAVDDTADKQGNKDCVVCDVDEDDPNIGQFNWKKIPTYNTDCNTCKDCTEDGIFDRDLVHFDFPTKTFYKYTSPTDEANGNNKIIVNLQRDIKLNNEHHFKLAIENVNRYLYKVEVEANDMTFESRMPPLLQSLFIGDTGSFLSGLMGAYTKSITTDINKSSLSVAVKENGKKTCMTDLQCKQKQFTYAIIEFKKRYDYLNLKKSKAYNICNKFQCCTTNDDEFDKETFALLQSLTWVRIKLMKLQNAIREDDSLAAQKKTYLSYIDQLLACQNYDNAAQKAQKQYDDTTKLFGATSIDAQKKTLADLQTKLNAANSNKCSAAKIETLNKAIAQLETSMKYFAAIDNIQATLPSEKDITNASLFVQNMRKSSNRYVTPPMFVNGNELELNIRVTPRDTLTSATLDRMAPYYIIPAAFKPFVSFSSGSFLSLDQYTQNNTYAWQAVPNANNQVVADSNKYLLTRSGRTPRPYGLNALMHAEGKISKSFGIGLSAGVGLTLESTPRLAYLGGGSIMLGNRKQIAITYGIMGMNVDRINTNMQSIADNKIIYRSSASPATPATFKEFKTGQFISISYIVFTPGKGTISSSMNKQKKRDNDLAQAQADAKMAQLTADAAKARQAEAEANAKTKDAQK